MIHLQSLRGLIGLTWRFYAAKLAPHYPQEIICARLTFFFTFLNYNRVKVITRRLKMNQDDREIMIFSLIATVLAFVAELAVVF